MLQHVDGSSSPYWKPYVASQPNKKLQNSNPHPSHHDQFHMPKSGIELNYASNENISDNTGETQPYSAHVPRAAYESERAAGHKRKASANVPYQFPTANVCVSSNVFDPPKFGAARKGNVQCCPELPGDTDDIVAEGPSPPKCKQNNTPASQETNATSHVTSRKHIGENSMQSEASDSDSLGFLECSESLGNDKSSSSASNDGCSLPLVTQDNNMQEDDSTSGVLRTEHGGLIDSDVNVVLGVETLNYLIGREAKYAPDPYYLERYQPELTAKMRLILMDWMMEVCMEFRLKRETFHYAVNYVDRYLSLMHNVEKSRLQLIGVTSLYIAAKMEEIFAPKVSDFAKSTDDGYSVDQILKMETHIMKCLQWELAAPTLNMWANWYMSQWDMYIQQSPYALNHPLFRSLPDPLIVFKQPSEKAYARYRELAQILDATLLDVVSLQYQPRTLIAASMYVLLAYHFGQVSKEGIASEFSCSSSFLSPEYPFNDLFADFLGQSFGFQLTELLPSIQYMAGFMGMPFNYTLPAVPAEQSEAHFEDFISIQTYHPQQMEFISGFRQPC